MEIKGYNLSTDYESLWDLIQEGYRIPAWILYSKKADPPIYDIVEVKKKPYADSYMIGTRGRGYEGLDDGKEGFMFSCRAWDLKYAKPFKKEPEHVIPPEEDRCENCEGTGKDGHDRCIPVNWYICQFCGGNGKKVKSGDYVQLNDRLETVHIWSEEKEKKNNGRFIPSRITKEFYDREMKMDWNK